MVYVYKPLARTVDATSEVVKEMSEAGVHSTISRFYEFCIEKGLAEYRLDRSRFRREFERYLAVRDSSRRR